MAHKVYAHRKREPRQRISQSRRGYFYPGEAARILGLKGVDYNQLRRLLLAASGVTLSKTESRRWARFSFKDLVAMKKAVELAGGAEALRQRNRFRLKRVEKACASLRRELGVESPLASLKLALSGSTIVARLDGTSFEPLTGQLLIELRNSIEGEIIDSSTDLARRIRAEWGEMGRIRGDGRDLSADVSVASLDRLGPSRASDRKRPVKARVRR